MSNDNFKTVQNVLDSTDLKNIKIVLNRGSNPGQCVNMNVYDLNGNILEDKFAMTTYYYVSIVKTIFAYLDRKFGIKSAYAVKPADTENFSHNLSKMITDSFEDIFENIINPMFIADNRKDYVPIFHSYFDDNKKNNQASIGSRYNLKAESVRQRIERVLFPVKRNFLERFEDYIYNINYMLNTDKKYIILEDNETIRKYKNVLSEIFKDYEYKINFKIDFSAGNGVIIKKDASLQDLLYYDTVPEDIKKRIEKVYNMIDINGAKVVKHRTALMLHYLETNCREPKKLRDIQAGYIKMLEDNNLKPEGLLVYGKHSMENKLSRLNNMLLTLKKEYRYIPTESMEAVAKLVDLSQYHNVLISANKIYKENIEIMKKYDIRNCYELHNLLKKYVTREDVVFKRMPTIRFGKADRNTQVLELLKKLSPIKLKQLARAYEQEYGDATDTVLGSYFNSIAKYKIDDKYYYKETGN